MNPSGFLDQLLRSAKDLAADTRERASATSDRIETQGIGGLRLGKLAQGAIAGGALSLLLGSRGGRKLATYGGIAAIGTLAYRAYRDYQQQQHPAVATIEPRTVDRLPAPEAAEHGMGILVALVAASKADGHIDERERGLIHDEIERVSQDAQMQAWFDAELAKPLDPVQVAAAAKTPELAAEMYLASLLVVDEQSYMERAYLDELARQLKLDAPLKESLEKQIRIAP